MLFFAFHRLTLRPSFPTEKFPIFVAPESAIEPVKSPAPMIIKILIAVAIVLAVIAIVATFQSSTYRVVRTATFSAPPASVFAQANDLRKYQTWNPFGKSDPKASYVYEGPSTGVGSILKWSSTGQTGEGTMSIVESRPNERVRYRLVFIRPMAGTGDMALTFQAQGNQTLVTWTMEGDKNYLAKLMGLFMNMDKMMGGAFERGLAELKTIAEKDGKS